MEHMNSNDTNNRHFILNSSSGPFTVNKISSTRISESQHIHITTSFSQGIFPMTMNSSSNNNESRLTRNDIEREFARGFMKFNLDGNLPLNDIMSSPDGPMNQFRMQGNMISNTNGLSMAATSIKTQQQVFSTSSSSCSNAWSSNSTNNKDDNNQTTRISSFASAGGSISSHSISTNSAGFRNCPTSFSNSTLSSMLMNNDGSVIRPPSMISGGGGHNNGNALFKRISPPLSPGRMPFTFRGFEQSPIWSNGGNFGNHISTNNDGEIFTRIKSSGQAHVNISQSYIQAKNGSIESFDTRQLVIRQSYGASESESDEEDEFVERKKIGYKQRPAIGFQKKLAIMDKPNTSYPPSEADTTCSEVPSDSIDIETPGEGFTEKVPSLPDTPEHKKCYKVAQELLTTERTYVKILHLIDQEFHFRVDTENRNKVMFPNEIVTQMFCNIKSLYRLHHEHLLPRLESRLERWEDDPRIGDIMKEFAPFLKMYSEYVQNFDNSINLINYYRDKNPRFANIINEVQKLEACANLPVQHHLIGPIQRIPRYRLLLEAYIKRLADNSNDKKDSEDALSIVSKAAEHANEAMRRIAGFKKLLEVQEQIKGAIDLVSPTRTLIKEGKVSKISARNDYHQERYLFLFSDMVLLCSMRAMANIISGPTYQLRAKLDVAELTISEGDDLEVQNSFYINDDNKRIELYTSTPEEKRAWMEAMYQARTDLMARKSSLRPGSSRLSVEDLGVVEPPKIKSNSVSKCMECNADFSLTRRRHHCHACGSVVCDKCSRAKLKMEYGEGKLERVCDSCKIVLQGKEVARRNGPDLSSPDELFEKVQGVLDVPGSIPAVLSGYLDLRLREKKEWITRWFALRSDFVLYCYSKDADERATTATPIPGMDVVMADELPKNEVSNLPAAERDRSFRITHTRGRKHFFFLAPSREAALNWVDKLKQASKADLNVNNMKIDNEP